MSNLNPPQDFNVADFLAIYSSQGFARIEINNKILLIEDFQESKFDNIYLVIDRSIFSKNEDYLNRTIDSIENAFNIGNGSLLIKKLDDNSYHHFTKNFKKMALIILSRMNIYLALIIHLELAQHVVLW